MSGQVTISVDHVAKRYRRYSSRNNSLKAALVQRTRGKYDEFWALDDVTLDIHSGETFGLVGHNGSGKSTLLKCIAGILRPDRGAIATHGRISSLLELGTGFHPELSGRENVYLNGTFFGYSRREITAKMEAIVDFSGLDDFIDEPVKTYSSGMFARLGFAVATHVDPEILLVDEILAVGDEEFQRRCIERIVQFRREGRTIVFVSHAMGSVRLLCDRAVWLDHGHMRGLGDPSELIDNYLDEATAGSEEKVALGSEDSWLQPVVVHNAAGETTTAVRTGDAVSLEISWNAPRRLAAPVVGFAIHRHDGVLVYATDTKIARLDLDVEVGPGGITFEIESFPAFAGTYRVDIAIAEHWGEKTVTALRPGGAFNVMGGTDRESSGIFTPGGTWRVGQVRPTQRTHGAASGAKRQNVVR